MLMNCCSMGSRRTFRYFQDVVTDAVEAAGLDQASCAIRCDDLLVRKSSPGFCIILHHFASLLSDFSDLKKPK